MILNQLYFIIWHLKLLKNEETMFQIIKKLEEVLKYIQYEIKFIKYIKIYL